MKLGGVFIIAVIASLSLQAQTTVEEANGTIRATASSLHKAGEELVVSISVEITRDLSSNESLVLVPLSPTVWRIGWNCLPSTSIAGNSKSYSCAKWAKRRKMPVRYNEKTEAGKAYIICNPFLSRSG